MFFAGDVMQWVCVVVSTLTCQRMNTKPDPQPRQTASVDIEASVQKTETWTVNKKFTVYKVVVVSPTECWFIFRRYNEFYKLHDVLKKQFEAFVEKCYPRNVPNFQLKLPGKKLFGNNLDPQFVAQRRDGLNAFVQQLMQDPKLLNIGEVRSFLQLDARLQAAEDSSVEDSCEKAVQDETLNLGPSERVYVKPSDFEFLHVIGKGSFGKVLLARHKCDSKHYAVKVLSKRLILRQNETQHIMSERNVLMKNLHHPFLVGLHFSFQTRDKLFFVLDYVNGGELFFHLQRERTFTEPRARFYAAEIASALGYLHAQGVVYRDLKPENLLLDAVGHVVLTDFGLSKEGLRATDTTNTFCGTPEYLAPEVVRKEAYDRSVDWWCLGAVLFEMLYGLPPFYSRNTAEMYDQILYQPLRLRPGPSEPAKKILSELLEKNSSRRLGSGYGDFDDVRNHEFFRSINWSDLFERKIKPPFNPRVKGELDMQHIDPSFIRESLGSIGLSQTGSALTASVRDADEHFAGFSYSYAAPIDFGTDRTAKS